MNKKFFEDLKFEIPLDIQEQQKIRLQKNKQIELIYRMQTKRREECDNAKLKSIFENNSNKLEYSGNIYISELELSILNDIAIMYQYQHEFGHMFSHELNGFIDINICDIVERTVQDAKSYSKQLQETLPEYKKRANIIGEERFLIEYGKVGNMYEKILEMKKEKNNMNMEKNN